jgi:ATP-binding cassette subfamily B protein
MKRIHRTLSNIVFLLRPCWKCSKAYVICSTLVAAIAAPLSAIVGVTVAQAVIEAVQGGSGIVDVLRILLGYFGVYAACFLLGSGGVMSYWGGVFETKLQTAVKREVIVQAQITDFKYIDDPQYYRRFLMTLNMYAERSRNTMAMCNNAFTTVVTIAAMLGILARTGLIIALIILAGVILQMIFFGMSTKVAIKYIPQTVEIERRVDYTATVYRTNPMFGDLKSTRVVSFLLRSFDKSAAALLRTRKQYSGRITALGTAQQFSSTFMDYAVIIYVAWGLINGRIGSVGEYATLVAAAARLSNSMMGITILAQFDRATQEADLIREFYEQKSTIEPSGGDAVPDGKLKVDITDASFTYPNSAFALKGISLSAEPGAKIAIVGENGAGKSTLMKLLLRLYDVDGGEVRYNDRNIREYDARSLRRRVGISFQHPNVYALSLRDNLKLYHEADDETLRRALAQVGLSRLCGSLDFEVTKEFSEDGIMLSGGETQKLGIARLLVGDFGLLLLDEPSSALDPVAEREVTDLLFSSANRATTIMIAHRLSTVRNADMIYVVLGGEVAERGTHGELIATNGIYANMFTLQAENYLDSEE